MQRPFPLTRDLVLVGGGHAHALLLRRWGMTPVPGVRLTLINPEPTAPYTGMLPGHIAGHYDRDTLEIDLVRLARFAGARLVLGRVDGIDRTHSLVRVTGHPAIRYDVAALDVGVTSGMPDLPGFAVHGVAAKPLAGYAIRWAAFCAAVAAGTLAPQVCVIGAGVAGVELALAMQHRLVGLGVAPRVAPQVALVDAGAALAAVSGSTRAVLFERLRRAGIRVLEHRRIAEVTATEVRLTSGSPIPAALTVGAAGARPHPWVAGLGLAQRDGYLTVDRFLRSVTDPAIFAVGDCADLGFAPRPKAGVYAVRAAPILYRNLVSALAGGARTPFHPQRDYLKLISLGGREAVADRSGLTLSGAWLWRQKDRIDRRFMQRLSDLRPMAPPLLPSLRARGMAAEVGTTPPCAGCGAKVGGGALAAALAGLPAMVRADVLSGPGDDAAILAIGGIRQVLTTDHLRGFTLDPVMLARIAATHALGDVWAMGAAPQAALATVILPRMTEAMQRETLREILDTAAQVFRAEGAEIVGGHTSLGDELTLGFSVTGLCDRAPITLAGGRPGDALILTKPIGSGTLLAAEMQLKARGPDVAAALAMMARPQGAAARLLAQAHAMTDVTGFGLAGHLLALCAASGVGARLDLAAIPVYAGAESLAARGIRSTLYPANRAALDGRYTLPDTPRGALLFDPQTAGGLIAAVPSAEAADVVARLRDLGWPAARIGDLTAGPPYLAAS